MTTPLSALLGGVFGAGSAKFSGENSSHPMISFFGMAPDPNQVAANNGGLQWDDLEPVQQLSFYRDKPILRPLIWLLEQVDERFLTGFLDLVSPVQQENANVQLIQQIVTQTKAVEMKNYSPGSVDMPTIQSVQKRFYATLKQYWAGFDIAESAFLPGNYVEMKRFESNVAQLGHSLLSTMVNLVIDAYHVRAIQCALSVALEQFRNGVPSDYLREQHVKNFACLNRRENNAPDISTLIGRLINEQRFTNEVTKYDLVLLPQMFKAADLVNSSELDKTTVSTISVRGGSSNAFEWWEGLMRSKKLAGRLSYGGSYDMLAITTPQPATRKTPPFSSRVVISEFARLFSTAVNPATELDPVRWASTAYQRTGYSKSVNQQQRFDLPSLMKFAWQTNKTPDDDSFWWGYGNVDPDNNALAVTDKKIQDQLWLSEIVRNADATEAEIKSWDRSITRNSYPSEKNNTDTFRRQVPFLTSLRAGGDASYHVPKHLSECNVDELPTQSFINSAASLTPALLFKDEKLNLSIQRGVELVLRINDYWKNATGVKENTIAAWKTYLFARASSAKEKLPSLKSTNSSSIFKPETKIDSTLFSAPPGYASWEGMNALADSFTTSFREMNSFSDAAKKARNFVLALKRVAAEILTSNSHVSLKYFVDPHSITSNEDTIESICRSLFVLLTGIFPSTTGAIIARERSDFSVLKESDGAPAVASVTISNYQESAIVDYSAATRDLIDQLYTEQQKVPSLKAFLPREFYDTDTNNRIRHFFHRFAYVNSKVANYSLRCFAFAALLTQHSTESYAEIMAHGGVPPFGILAVLPSEQFHTNHMLITQQRMGNLLMTRGNTRMKIEAKAGNDSNVFKLISMLGVMVMADVLAAWSSSIQGYLGGRDVLHVADPGTYRANDRLRASVFAIPVLPTEIDGIRGSINLAQTESGKTYMMDVGRMETEGSPQVLLRRWSSFQLMREYLNRQRIGHVSDEVDNIKPLELGEAQFVEPTDAIAGFSYEMRGVERDHTGEIVINGTGHLGFESANVNGAGETLDGKAMYFPSLYLPQGYNGGVPAGFAR